MRAPGISRAARRACRGSNRRSFSPHAIVTGTLICAPSPKRSRAAADNVSSNEGRARVREARPPRRPARSVWGERRVDRRPACARAERRIGGRPSAQVAARSARSAATTDVRRMPRVCCRSPQMRAPLPSGGGDASRAQARSSPRANGRPGSGLPKGLSGPKRRRLSSSTRKSRGSARLAAPGVRGAVDGGRSRRDHHRHGRRRWHPRSPSRSTKRVRRTQAKGA